MNRRTFLLAAGALPLAMRSLAQPANEPEPAPAGGPAALPSVELLGRPRPRLGLGAYPLGALRNDEEAARVLLRAFDLGVRYIDTAPSYSGGRSEERVGGALRDWIAGDASRRRDDFFIATKTLRRDGAGARRELEQSLRRLGLEHVDSVQCHEVHDDVDRLFGEGSVTAALEKARDEGLVRHIGVTGHRDPRWLVESITRYPFATALVPVNPIDVRHLSFVRGFLPAAAERKVAVIAMKVYGGGFLLARKGPDGGPAFSAADLLTYALAQRGVAIAVPGCDRVEHVDEAHAAVAANETPPPEALAEWEARAGEHEGKATEWYKDEVP